MAIGVQALALIFTQNFCFIDLCDNERIFGEAGVNHDRFRK